MRTIIGIDPHKSSLTAVAVDDKGAVLGTRRLTVNKGTGTALLKWAAAFEDPLYAIEGAKGLGGASPRSWWRGTSRSSTCRRLCQ